MSATLAPTNPLTTAARTLLAARSEADKAEAAKKAAEKVVIAIADACGENEVVVDGITVRVEERPNPRKFDVGILAEFLPVEVVAAVLKEVVDPAEFDARVKVGIIPSEVADKAVTATTTTQVRVYGPKS